MPCRFGPRHWGQSAAEAFGASTGRARAHHSDACNNEVIEGILILGMLEVTDSMLANAKACPIRNVLDEVGKKWSLLVMLSLGGKRRRFMDVKRSIGDVTQRVLTQTLRKLERDGYISRQVYPTSPPTVEYWLTPMGLSLLELVGGLVVWANQHFDKVMEARKRFDQVNPARAEARESNR